MDANGIGPPGGIRTHYPRLRRPVLYPDELRADALFARGASLAQMEQTAPGEA
jgi:hypothetical protein